MAASRITVERLPRQTFAAFLDEHDLTVKVVEREPADLECCARVNKVPRAQVRFLAHLRRVDLILDSGLSCGAFGDGATWEEAVRAVAAGISGRTVRIWPESDAYAESVKLRAPIFVEEGHDAD